MDTQERIPSYLTVVDDLFTPEECVRIIETFKKGAPKSSQVGSAFDKRVALVDSALAARVFSKVRHLVPARFNVVSANELFRFSEYEEGGEFKSHKDGVNQDTRGEQSVITVNVFLNGSDQFAGGSTNFFHDDAGRTLRRSVLPQAGRAAIFDAQQFHCGCPVSRGRKYLLRTDLVVSRPPWCGPDLCESPFVPVGQTSTRDSQVLQSDSFGGRT